MVEVRVDVGELFKFAVVTDEGVSVSVLSVEVPLWKSSWNECRILSVRANISSFRPSPSISTHNKYVYLYVPSPPFSSYRYLQ